MGQSATGGTEAAARPRNQQPAVSAILLWSDPGANGSCLQLGRL